LGRVIPFSQFDKYLKAKSAEPHYCPGTILDTNILISLTYELKKDHDEVLRFFASIGNHEIPYYSTVTTRSEYLDFHRRLRLTETLLDATEPGSPWKLSSRTHAEIKTKQGLLRARMARKVGSDPVFTDTDLKDIKRVFSAGVFSGHHGWLSICEGELKNWLAGIERRITDHGVNYISQHDDSQKMLFSKRIDWPDARSISEVSGLGLSDSMILNALNCSRFSFAVSADFDLGYAVLADRAGKKDVVMPDSKAAEYRGFHFPKD
jgi:predicted nucleic acid-binding protein